MKLTNKEIHIASKFFAVSNMGMGRAKDENELDDMWYMCMIDVADDPVTGKRPVDLEREHWEEEIRNESEYCLSEWAEARGRFGFSG